MDGSNIIPKLSSSVIWFVLAFACLCWDGATATTTPEETAASDAVAGVFTQGNTLLDKRFLQADSPAGPWEISVFQFFNETGLETGQALSISIEATPTTPAVPAIVFCYVLLTDPVEIQHLLLAKVEGQETPIRSFFANNQVDGPVRYRADLPSGLATSGAWSLQVLLHDAAGSWSQSTEQSFSVRLADTSVSIGK